MQCPYDSEVPIILKESTVSNLPQRSKSHVRLRSSATLEIQNPYLENEAGFQ